MFLMDPALASNWPTAEAEINRILQRAGAEIIGITNWGERKLAYQIGRFKRGLYALTYFKAPPENVGGLERDVQLSEHAVRFLLIRRDKMTPEMIEKSLKAEPPPKVPVRGDEWSARAKAIRVNGDRPARKFDKPAGDKPADEGKPAGEGDTSVAVMDKPGGEQAPATDVADKPAETESTGETPTEPEASS
jgi:small subunit ribosomal protein S6